MDAIDRVLDTLYGNASNEEKKAACMALGAHLDDRRAIEALKTLIEDEEADLMEKAAQILGGSGNVDWCEYFAGLLEREDRWGFRHKAAARALGALAFPKGVDALLKGLDATPWAGTKEAMVAALGAIGDPGALDALKTCLVDASYGVRCAAAEALGRIEHRRSGEALVEVLQDDDRWGALHRAAAMALARLQETSAIPFLVSLLRQERLGSVQDGVLEALQTLGAESVGYLLSVLEDAIPSTQDAIVHALSALGEAEAATSLINALRGDESTLPLLMRLAKVGDIRGMSVLGRRLERLVAAENPFMTALLEKHIAAMLAEALPVQRHFLCMRDLTRFERRPAGRTATLVCRVCGESVHGKTVQRLVAVLDRDFDQAVIASPDEVQAPWREGVRLFDFDRVAVVRANDEEVLRLCMAARNSTDPFRRDGFGTIDCQVDAACVLSESTMNILKKTFDVGPL